MLDAVSCAGKQQDQGDLEPVPRNRAFNRKLLPGESSSIAFEFRTIASLSRLVSLHECQRMLSERDCPQRFLFLPPTY